MKTYTIIGGVNGTGKSSLTGILKSERNDLGYIIDVDKLVAEKGSDSLLAIRFASNQIYGFIKKGITCSGYDSSSQLGGITILACPVLF